MSNYTKYKQYGGNIDYIILWIFFVPVLLFLWFKITSNLFIEFFDIKGYKKTIKNNDKKKLYKILLDNKIKLYDSDCESHCDNQNCVKLNNKTKILKQCIECNKYKNKCFKMSIIGGNCDDCKENEEKIDCLNTGNFGCINPKDLQSYNGVIPYYIELPDNNPNSPFNKKCVFCWNILDNI